MMRKIINLSITLTLLLLALACQKVQEDKVYPTLIIEGNNPMKLIQGCEWEDPGFSVKDDKPGTRLYTTGLLNTNSSGEFYVDYIAIDSDSNQVSARRVVNISPLQLQDVTAEYMAVDTTGLNNPIISYKSTISIFSSSPLLLKINNLNNKYEAFFTFDSTGNLEVNFDANDILIVGTGQYQCDKTFFNLKYYIDSSNVVEHHKATFTKIN